MTPARTISIDDIQGPPIPGKFYMVPTVFAEWNGIKKWYPVRGSLHTDDDPINFRLGNTPDSHLIPHVHLDPRFMDFDDKHHSDLMFHVIAPLCAIKRTNVLQKDAEPFNTELGNVVCRRLKCRRQTVGQFWNSNEARNVSWRPRLQTQYGGGAAEAKMHKGRWICPHRGVDITSEPADGLGRRICPLHGLVLKCSSPHNLLDGVQHMEFPEAIA